MTTVYPLIIRLGRLELTGFGITMMVAFLMGGWLVGLELKRRGWYQEYAADITVAAVGGGGIGGQLWYVALTRGLCALLSRSGRGWDGGLLGGLVGGVCK